MKKPPSDEDEKVFDLDPAAFHLIMSAYYSPYYSDTERRRMSSLQLGRRLIELQPLPEPTGAIFYLDYKYPVPDEATSEFFENFKRWV